MIGIDDIRLKPWPPAPPRAGAALPFVADHEHRMAAWRARCAEIDHANRLPLLAVGLVSFAWRFALAVAAAVAIVAALRDNGAALDGYVAAVAACGLTGLAGLWWEFA